jgi:perosamine synthetase
LIGSTIPMSAPDVTDSDVDAVVRVLKSGEFALGPQAMEFERLCSELAGVPHAVAVSSGTAALHLIVRALGIGPGDEVLVPSFTFAASVNAILFEGATPVFVDIDPLTYNLDPADLERRIGTRSKAVMVVDVFGHPADWDAICDVASRHGIRLIDDACEAIGARHRGRALGGFGDAAAFAFYPNKQITTGEGGMILTRDEGIASLCMSLRNQGRSDMGPWLEHDRLGFNYRMDEMSAALGVSQLSRLSELLQKRAAVAAMYSQRLAGLDWVRTPVICRDVEMSWFVYVVQLAPGIDRAFVMSRMAEEGAPTRAYFPPLHLQPYIRERLGTRPGDLPVTEEIASRTIALPFHGNMTAEQVDRVVAALAGAVSAAGTGRP